MWRSVTGHVVGSYQVGGNFDLNLTIDFDERDVSRTMPDAVNNGWYNAGENSDFQSTAASGRSPRLPLRPMDIQSSPSSPPLSASPPSRAGVDLTDTSSTNWRDTATVLSDAQESLAEPVHLVEPGFDESVLRSLCDMDVSAGTFLYAI